MKYRVILAALCLFIVAAATRAAGHARLSKPAPRDNVLAAARRFVENSDHYLYQSYLHRGMKGYGLTVMSGTKPVRFNVEIVSVVTNWFPQQDVILARLSGLGLEKSGIIAGMSGSPVYVKDPRDGKFKLIGAVAYGWSFQNAPPLCGIQPITQMLAVGRAFEQGKDAGKPGRKKPAPATGPATVAAWGPSSRKLLAAVLDPRKRDFTRFFLPVRTSGRDARPGGLRPLLTPLMVTGMTDRGMEQLRRQLRGVALRPVRGGGITGRAAKKALSTKFSPGSAISISLVRGDADWYAMGTVTDVIGKRVLMFGHSFDAAGRLRLPMGPASVHAVMSSRYSSFKLGSTISITGATDYDENSAVSGVIGNIAPIIPMYVNVDWKSLGRKQRFHYELCRHRLYSVILPRYLVGESVLALHGLPPRNTVRYDLKVDYGKFGSYAVSNISTGNDIADVISDISRPLAAMGANIFAPPRLPDRIEVNITIQKGQINASIMHLRLDSPVWRPGQTVTGEVAIRPTRKPRRNVPIKFDLPADLPDGTYTLEVCDAIVAVQRERSENPQRFDPRNEAELFAAIKRVVGGRRDRLYLRLPLRRGGMALGETELPSLPASRAGMLKEAKLPHTKTFKRAIVKTLPMKYVMFGSAKATFKVLRQPRERLLLKTGN